MVPHQYGLELLKIASEISLTEPESHCVLNVTLGGT
jgi:hypothetical protein